MWDPRLRAFFQRLPSDPHRNFAQSLFKSTPEGDEETHFALLRFLFALGRPSDVAKDKAAQLRSVGPLERALELRVTIWDLTPLHLTAIAGHVDLARLLLEAAARQGSVDAVVRATDSLGYTPLHLAVAFGHRRLWSHLIEAGARDEVLTSFGATAADLARRLGRDDYLEDAGQRPEPLVVLIDPGDGQGVRRASEELLRALPVTLQPWTRVAPDVFNVLYLESVGPLDHSPYPAVEEGFAERFEACQRDNPSSLYVGRVTADDEGRPLGEVGWGLFAQRDLPAGHLIPYGGVVELVSLHTASDRNCIIDSDHRVWKQCIVEGTHQSNLGSFVNHGFPNCMWERMVHRGAMEAVLMTTEPVPAGTQLTAGYGIAMEKQHPFFELCPGRRRRFLAERYAEEAARLARYTEARTNDLRELPFDAHVEALGAFRKIEYLHIRRILRGIGDFEPHAGFERFVRRNLTAGAPTW
jgi:Ankyrin repeats (3 copies)/SET domain